MACNDDDPTRPKPRKDDGTDPETQSPTCWLCRPHVTSTRSISPSWQRNFKGVTLGSFALARQAWDEPEKRAVLLKQAAALTTCLARLVEAIDRHRKATREER